MGRSYEQLSLEERFRIAELRRAGASLRQIAADLDRAPSSVSRELKRNAGSQPAGYRPAWAQEQTRARRWNGARLDRNAALRRLHEEVGFEIAPPGHPIPRELIEGGLAVSVDVVGTRRTGFVGYKARKHTPVIDVDRINYYGVRDFWDPVFTRRGDGITLDPDDFYILASRERVQGRHHTR